MLTDTRYRKNHWVLTDSGVKFLDKDELKEVLKNPPPGSLVYVRASGRKLSFARALRFRSSAGFVALVHEDEGFVYMPRNRYTQLWGLAERAFNVFKKKTTLLEGCSTDEWVYEELCREVEEARGDPAWRIIVRVL